MQDKEVTRLTSRAEGARELPAFSRQLSALSLGALGVLAVALLVLLPGCSWLNKIPIEDQQATANMWMNVAKQADAELYGFVMLPTEGYLKEAIGHNGQAVLFLRFNPSKGEPVGEDEVHLEQDAIGEGDIVLELDATTP